MSKKVETEKKNVVVRRNKTGVKIAEHINLLSIAKLEPETQAYCKSPKNRENDFPIGWKSLIKCIFQGWKSLVFYRF